MYKQLLHVIPFLILIIAGLIVYFSGLTHYISIDTLRTYHQQITDYTATHPFLTPLLFISAYVTVAVLSLPLSIYLTLLAGYLFRQPYAVIYVVIGATLGACLIFLAARYAFRDFFKQQAGPYLIRFEKGFKENAVSYMLFLRLIPLFPYWIVNLAPAFLGIPFTTFLWTTALGIIPVAFAFTQIGRGMGHILDMHQEFTLKQIINSDVILALITLGFIALVPIIFKRWKKRKENIMTLKVGSTAPDFTLPNAEGKMVSLSQFKNQWVVLYFYPKDDTPNCTVEACTFTSALSQFKDLAAIIIGISPDSPSSHTLFINKFKIGFELLSDEDKKVINTYESWGKKMMFGKEVDGVLRTTYLIDPNGKIASIWEKVTVEGHADEVKTKLEKFKKMG